MVGPTAPTDRSRASASGRPTTSATTISYGLRVSSRPAGAAAARSQQPLAVRPHHLVPGCPARPGRAPAPGARSSARAPGRPAPGPAAAGPPGRLEPPGPSCGCEGSTCRTLAQRCSPRGPRRSGARRQIGNGVPSIQRGRRGAGGRRARSRRPRTGGAEEQGSPSAPVPSDGSVPTGRSSRAAAAPRPARLPGTASLWEADMAPCTCGGFEKSAWHGGVSGRCGRRSSRRRRRVPGSAGTGRNWRRAAPTRSPSEDSTVIYGPMSLHAEDASPLKPARFSTPTHPPRLRGLRPSTPGNVAGPPRRLPGVRIASAGRELRRPAGWGWTARRRPKARGYSRWPQVQAHPTPSGEGSRLLPLAAGLGPPHRAGQSAAWGGRDVVSGPRCGASMSGEGPTPGRPHGSGAAQRNPVAPAKPASPQPRCRRSKETRSLTSRRASHSTSSLRPARVYVTRTFCPGSSAASATCNDVIVVTAASPNRVIRHPPAATLLRRARPVTDTIAQPAPGHRRPRPAR